MIPCRQTEGYQKSKSNFVHPFSGNHPTVFLTTLTIANAIMTLKTQHICSIVHRQVFIGPDTSTGLSNP